MNYIEKFQSFTESLGISEPIEFYKTPLAHTAVKEIYKHLDRERSDRDLEEKSISVRIGITKIKAMIPKDQSEDYWKFPLSEITIIINFHKEEDPWKLVDKDGFKVPFMLGAFASPFAVGNERDASRLTKFEGGETGISANFSLEVYYSPGFKKLNINSYFFTNTSFFKKIESTIGHELNHLYEYYNRKIGKFPPMDAALSVTALEENFYGVPIEVYDFWQNNFTEWVYRVEPQEIRASIQEMKSYTDRLTFDKFMKTKNWKDAKKLENWKSEDFIKDFKKVLRSKRLNNSIIDDMKSAYIKKYEEHTIANKEYPFIDPNFLYKLSIVDFFKFFEKRITTGGKKLVRSYCRLYALK